MENEVLDSLDIKRYYLSEFELYDGECFITFNIVDINLSSNEILLAITNRGKISVVTYNLHRNDKGMYFEYGVAYEKVNIQDFVEVEL